VAVHVGHLQLVLEVGHGAQAAQDDGGVLALAVVDQQAVERVDLDARGVEAARLDGRARDLDALFHGEQGLLLLVVEHGDRDAVERHQPALQDGHVPIGDGVERAGVDGVGHAAESFAKGKAP